jgi:hypothetical protein
LASPSSSRNAKTGDARGAGRRGGDSVHAGTRGLQRASYIYTGCICVVPRRIARAVANALWAFATQGAYRRTSAQRETRKQPSKRCENERDAPSDPNLNGNLNPPCCLHQDWARPFQYLPQADFEAPRPCPLPPTGGAPLPVRRSDGHMARASHVKLESLLDSESAAFKSMTKMYDVHHSKIDVIATVLT